ncbi:MAG: hypothetical protein ACR5K4_01925 [Sodalis sp. (in: enterobacteria)]
MAYYLTGHVISVTGIDTYLLNDMIDAINGKASQGIRLSRIMIEQSDG